ncbi:MAG: NUDIX domain-containing protein [Myxococcota bacterium]
MSDEKQSKPDHASELQKWAESGNEGTKPVLAATVLLLRDGAQGLETLMLRRNSKIAFGGMWVFPGGRLDPEDWDGIDAADELAASRVAAEREAMEECGLVAPASGMVPFSHWTPPPITPKRFLTWFFIARASEGEVAIDHGEIHESSWMSPVEALRRRDAAEIELAPPTFVSLTELAGYGEVDEALETVAKRENERFQTRIGVADAGPVAMWHGDAGYAETDPAAAGGRHRLTMVRGGSWSYERSD